MALCISTGQTERIFGGHGPWIYTSQHIFGNAGGKTRSCSFHSIGTYGYADLVDLFALVGILLDNAKYSLAAAEFAAFRCIHNRERENLEVFPMEAIGLVRRHIV